MKKNDIALLILIVSLSAITTYFLGRAIVGDPSNNVAQVEYVEPIDSTVTPPNEKVFNANAINPTVPIQIGQPSNQQPFNAN